MNEIIAATEIEVRGTSQAIGKKHLVEGKGLADSSCKLLTANHSEIRADQAATSMRIGFVLRHLEHVLSEMWTAPLLRTSDVETTLKELDQLLLMLSHRVNEFERLKYGELRQAIESSFFVSLDCRSEWLFSDPELDSESLRQRVTDDSAASTLRRLQSFHLKNMQTILTNVIGTDVRLTAWFDIGEFLGKMIFQLVRGEIPLPEPSKELTDFKIVLLGLPPALRQTVEPFFPLPRRYRSRLHLARELVDCYSGLCALVNKLSPMPIPFWDGITISFRRRTHSVRLQRNSVMPPILDEFQRLGWTRHVTLSSSFKGNVRNAVSTFNESAPIRLSHADDQVSWRDPEDWLQS